MLWKTQPEKENSAKLSCSYWQCIKYWIVSGYLLPPKTSLLYYGKMVTGTFFDEFRTMKK